MSRNLTLEQKKVDTDLSIIAIITGIAFLLYMIVGNVLTDFIKNAEINVLLRVGIAALFQFSIAGLGSVIAIIFRKETLSQFGLQKAGAIQSIVGAILCFIPYLTYILASGQFQGYHPLSVLLLPDVLASPLLEKAVGLLIIGLAWGFFEGFNYAVISLKINARYPHQKIDFGAIVCAIICVLVHPFSTSFWGIIEIGTTIVFIYGMILVAHKTNNSWGCVFAFLFLWNAF